MRGNDAQMAALTPDNQVDLAAAQQCASLAFAIADAMAEEAARHSQH